MNANDTGRMPPPLRPLVAALLVHERIPPSQPEMVRARALARAREALRDAPTATQIPRVGPTRVRWPLYAAAAGIALIAGVAAAFQIVERSGSTPPTGKGTLRGTAQPTVLPPSVEPALAPSKEAETTGLTSAAGSVKAPVLSRRTVLAGKREGGHEELQLLSRARQSDARGDCAEVLARVAEHERRYPAGRLSEEREVLRVKALVGLGRGSEARHAATKFRRQFPRSVLLPKIEDMLASLK
jgi:hypothetical protein